MAEKTPQDEKEKILVVSPFPHLRDSKSVQIIMLTVIIALLPAGIAGIYFFGFRSLEIIFISVISAIVTEGVIQKLSKKPVTINDFSAALTGLLLAYNLPPTVPLWLPALGAFFAIAVVKQAFGGLGHNFLNPALAARAFLLAAFPVDMTTWSAPFEAKTTATPLAIAKGLTEIKTLPTYSQLFWGNIPGCIGETSKAALLLGAVVLLILRIIDWRIPFGYLATVAIISWIFAGQKKFFSGDVPFHLFSGGLILGAFFMATDYVTSPVTKKGKIIMGIGCGIITCLIRLYGGYPEGVSYSILIMNLFTPLIDKFTMSTNIT